jgi:hypothetical protein
LKYRPVHRTDPDLDLFTVRSLNDEGFAWAAGEDEHGNVSFCLGLIMTQKPISTWFPA